MKFKFDKHKTSIILILLVVAVSILLFFIVSPFVKKVYQKKDSIEESKLVLKKDQDNKERYQKDLEYFKEKSFLSEDLILTENNKIRLIENLEKVAFEQNLKFKIENYDLKSSTKKNKETKDKIFLKLILNGEYEKFMNFLYILQNFRYPIDLEKVAIEKFDNSKVKNNPEFSDYEKLPEIESEIIISFN